MGEDRVVLGGLDDRAGVLVDGSLEDIEQQVHKILRENGTQRFILGADCTLPTDISLERIAKAVEATGTYQD